VKSARSDQAFPAPPARRNLAVQEKTASKRVAAFPGSSPDGREKQEDVPWIAEASVATTAAIRLNRAVPEDDAKGDFKAVMATSREGSYNA
jgi:hypothetical protein